LILVKLTTIKNNNQEQQPRTITKNKEPEVKMTFGLFIVAILLYVFTTIMIINIMSIFVKKPDEEYVNPYRLVPRKETEEYKRYERREYLNRLRS
jgi:hypothetical protein